MAKASTPLDDPKINVKLRLSALWASLMFCYVYGDYFGLYVPGKLAGMLAGRMAPLGAVTPNVLLGTSAMMAVPALMVCLALLLALTLGVVAARQRWSTVLVWVIATPLAIALSWASTDVVMRLLPNLI